MIKFHCNGEDIIGRTYDDVIKKLDGRAFGAEQFGDMDSYYRYDQHSEHARREKNDGQEPKAETMDSRGREETGTSPRRRGQRRHYRGSAGP